MMSFGFSIGDFIAVGALAWNVYKSCKAAPESFANVSLEVQSLHAVLKEIQELWEAQPPPSSRKLNLKVVSDGCSKVLVDLQDLVDKYHGLDTKSKRSWDTFKFAQEDINDLRSRLNSNVLLLNTFIRLVAHSHGFPHTWTNI
jgi:hypothetical protein